MSTLAESLVGGTSALVLCWWLVPAVNADTLTLQDQPGGYQGTYDTYLRSGGPYEDENYGGADNLEVMWRNYLRDSLIRFELPPLPELAFITSASLSLYYCDDYQMTSSDWMTVAVFPLRRDWTEGNGDGQGGTDRSGAAWLYRRAYPDQSGWANAGARSPTQDRYPADAELTLYGDAYGWKTWSGQDVTHTVGAWCAGTLANNGWVIDFTAANEDAQGVYLIAADFPDASWQFHPKLVINYYVAGPGDLNCDGSVNAFDIDPFVLALTDPVAYAAMYPACAACLADVNGDGMVNSFDIDPFVALLTGG